MKRGNASATQHYFHYYLTDENGKHIGSKGVKLNDSETLPTQIEPIRDQEPKTPTKTRSTQQAEVMNALTEQVQSLAQENQRIWEQINTMKASVPQASTTTDTTFFTREIESLRSQLEAMQQERDLMATELEQAKTEKETLQQKLTQIHQSYQQRIEGLTELLKQTPPIPQSTPVQPTQEIATVQAAEPKPQEQTAKVIQPKPKREHITKTGSADQRIEAAMRAIMRWNYEHEFDRDKFALNQSCKN